MNGILRPINIWGLQQEPLLSIDQTQQTVPYYLYNYFLPKLGKEENKREKENLAFLLGLPPLEKYEKIDYGISYPYISYGFPETISSVPTEQTTSAESTILTEQAVPIEQRTTTQPREEGINLRALTPYIFRFLTTSGVPAIQQLLSGEAPTALFGPSSLGTLGAAIGSLTGQELAPAIGGYLGSVAGNILSGAPVGQATISGLPSLGVSLLSQALPEEARVIMPSATPVISALTQSLMGAPVYGWGTLSPALASTLESLGGLGSALAPILSYAGPLGMVLGGVGAVIGDIIGAHKEKKAEKKAEKKYIANVKQHEDKLLPIYDYIKRFIPAERQSLDLYKQMATLPDWAQGLLVGKTPLYHYSDLVLKDPSLLLAASPMLNTFKDPQLTSSLVSGTLIGLTYPEYANFELWKSLDPLKKFIIVSSIKPNMTIEDWNKLGQQIGIAEGFDPFQIIGGMYDEGGKAAKQAFIDQTQEMSPKYRQKALANMTNTPWPIISDFEPTVKYYYAKSAWNYIYPIATKYLTRKYGEPVPLSIEYRKDFHEIENLLGIPEGTILTLIRWRDWYNPYSPSDSLWASERA